MNLLSAVAADHPFVAGILRVQAHPWERKESAQPNRQRRGMWRCSGPPPSQPSEKVNPEGRKTPKPVSMSKPTRPKLPRQASAPQAAVGDAVDVAPCHVPQTAVPEPRSGKGMTKSPNSESVINIVLPRELWGGLQMMRSSILDNQRCGPHLSFIDPFVLPEFHAEAAELLRRALAGLKPFRMTLNKFGHFKHGAQSSLFVDPEIDPPDALENLIQTILEIFPQCNDTVLRSGKFIPHFTVAKVPSNTLSRVQKEWEPRLGLPIEFTVREVYVLHRRGGDPFHVEHAIPLGEATQPPEFGNPNESHRAACTVFLAGFPKVAWKFHRKPSPEPCNLTTEDIVDLAHAAGCRPMKAKLFVNPSGNNREFALLEFKTVEEANQARECLNSHQPWKRAGMPYELYTHPLYEMVYPDVLGGTCSPEEEKEVEEQDW
eukprot:Sspe_Gene.65810::Locus_38908_Transcript_4_7_Confidence_0.364_Length_1448::g.65810::m.65810